MIAEKNRVLKCDFIKKIQTSISGQIVSEIVAQYAPMTPLLQILLDFTRFLMNWVKFKRIVMMESLEHNCANNSDTICHEMLVIGMYLIDLADFRHV